MWPRDWSSDVCSSDLDPEHANAYNALGYIYADQNRNLAEAQNLLEHAMELEPDNPYVLDSVGWYLYRVGEIGRGSCREGGRVWEKGALAKYKRVLKYV